MSLIEALVAMAVMAFGMLAVMGVQSTLRFNGDVAKQRSEATRIAERELEELRAFKDFAAWEGVTQVLNTPVDFEVGGKSNVTYIVNRRVTNSVGLPQKVLSVEVTWKDRLGNDQSVVLGDTLARAAPVLSALATMPAVRTSASQNRNRHPTIPPRAHDMGNGESVFRPVERVGNVAWTFDNVTGVITRVCTVDEDSTSSSLTSGDLTSCITTAAQLVSGVIRQNLRGSSSDLADGTSAFKPIPSGTVAWLIDNTLSRIVRSCQVSAGSTSASLTPANLTGLGCTSMDVPKDLTDGTSVLKPYPAGSVAWVLSNGSGRIVRVCAVAVGSSTASLSLVDLASSNCTPVNPTRFPLSPFDPTVQWSAADSEDPRWPALPLTISIALTTIGHTDSPACITDAPSTSGEAIGKHITEYFCIIYPNTQKLWTGATTLTVGGFTDAGAPWSIGSDANDYRVCRYTTAASNVAVTANTNHPLAYTNVSGNLINQNFLIIAGQKSCPTDGAVNPAAGDFVNSYTLPHQPSS